MACTNFYEKPIELMGRVFSQNSAKKRGISGLVPKLSFHIIGRGKKWSFFCIDLELTFQHNGT